LIISSYYQLGKTALILAASEGHEPVVATLLKNNADIEIVNKVRDCYAMYDGFMVCFTRGME
jgi:ankyrin repeat protein